MEDKTKTPLCQLPGICCHNFCYVIFQDTVTQMSTWHCIATPLGIQTVTKFALPKSVPGQNAFTGLLNSECSLAWF